MVKFKIAGKLTGAMDNKKCYRTFQYVNNKLREIEHWLDLPFSIRTPDREIVYVHLVPVMVFHSVNKRLVFFFCESHLTILHLAHIGYEQKI